MADKMTDIIIIGGGTAGMTAAVYAGRAGRSVKVLEQSIHGGQIINTSHVENFPGFDNIAGFEFATALYDQAVKFGAEFVYEKVTGIENADGFKRVLTANGHYDAKAVIIATGARPRPIGVAGEEKFVGRGISFCATCDGAFYKGKTVAVIGGGNTALDDAVVLSQLAEKVYLIHRRQEFRAEKQLVEKVHKPENIEFILDTVVTGLKGDKRLEGLELENKVTGEKSELAVDGVFVAIGQMPENGMLKNVVEVDTGGYIVAGEDCKTSCPGIFAAGDGRTKKVRQLTTAAADGTVAALAASEYIG